MGDRRILVVDDDSVSRRAMEGIFRRKGWLVTSAATVGEALSQLEPAPDCVLLDLMLPDGDGETVLRRVREQNLPSRVIVTTGCEDDRRLVTVASLRPNAILRKPISLDQVCDACGEPRAVSPPPAKPPQPERGVP
jgi:CheY-like chemotaxis protein